MATAAAVCPTCLSVASAFASDNKLTSAADKSHEAAHWTYGGDTGPEQWGDMEAGNKVCSMGFQQSPIDLREAIPASPGQISVDYQPTRLRVVNNGHTIQCNIDAGSSMILDGETFRLLQFHFHHPSEHAMDGRRFDMEAHFVHINDAGRHSGHGWRGWASVHCSKPCQQFPAVHGRRRNYRHGRHDGAAPPMPRRSIPAPRR